MQDIGGGNGNGGALALCGALGLWMALEGAVPSRGRRWHRSGLRDGGGNSNGVALALRYGTGNAARTAPAPL